MTGISSRRTYVKCEGTKSRIWSDLSGAVLIARQAGLLPRTINR